MGLKLSVCFSTVQMERGNLARVTYTKRGAKKTLGASNDVAESRSPFAFAASFIITIRGSAKIEKKQS